MRCKNFWITMSIGSIDYYEDSLKRLVVKMDQKLVK